jgi:hypothetical protein
MLDWLCMNVPEDDLPPKFKVWRTPFSSLPVRQTAPKVWAVQVPFIGRLRCCTSCARMEASGVEQMLTFIGPLQPMRHDVIAKFTHDPTSLAEKVGRGPILCAASQAFVTSSLARLKSSPPPPQSACCCC